MMKKSKYFLFFILVIITIFLGSCENSEGSAQIPPPQNGDEKNDHEHIPAESVIENLKNATCTEKGSYDEVIYCSECDEELSRKKTETEPTHKIDKFTDNESESTCSVKGGYDEISYCTVCHKELTVERIEYPLLSHTPTEPTVKNEKKSTCTAKGGYDIEVYCSVCDKRLSKEHIEFELAEHIPSEPKIENKYLRDCTLGGSYEEAVYCNRCDVELSRKNFKILPEQAHDIEDHVCLDCDYVKSSENLILELNSDGKSYTVKGINGVGYSVYIGDSYGLPITHIATDAFNGDADIRKVVIGPTVRVIGAGAFYECENLVNLELKWGIEEIGIYAFAWCDLTSVYIPGSVKVIKDSAFATMDNLNSLKLGEGILKIEISAFSGNKFTYVSLPDSLEEIGSGAFSKGFRDDSAIRFDIGNSLVKLDWRALGNISEDSLVEYKNAFYIGSKENPYHILVCAKSKDITEIEIHKDTKIIYSEAFRECTALREVNFPEGLRSISYEAFFGCSSITSLVLNDSITDIEWRAFARCSSLKSISIGKGLASLPGYCFTQCVALSDVVIPDTVTVLGPGVFSGCASLEKIRIHSGISCVPASAFSSCINLSEVILEEGVEWIDDYAFWGCRSLTDINIPDSLLVIGDKAFSRGKNADDEYSLDNVILSYTEHNGAVYYGTDENPYIILLKVTDKSITEFEFEEGTRIIYDGAFDGCISLTSIEIPDSVTSIGTDAFGDCNSLSEISVGRGVVHIQRLAFAGYIENYSPSISFADAEGWSVWGFTSGSDEIYYAGVVSGEKMNDNEYVIKLFSACFRRGVYIDGLWHFGKSIK